jgi:DnaJ-class molecular chaperone
MTRVCTNCKGSGEVKKSNTEVIDCPTCQGLGGTNLDKHKQSVRKSMNRQWKGK